MSLPNLKIAQSQDPPAPPRPNSDPITAWLDTLSLVLKLPRDERDSVRDELAGHLRDRVRDLMLSGISEPAAAQTALSELGDAVNLAHRLRAASRTPTRRLAMNLTVLGVASAALITSVVALRGGSPAPQPSAITSTMPQPGVTVPDDLQKVRLTIDPPVTWGAFFDLFKDKSKMPIDVRWASLESQGYMRNEPMHVTFRDTTLPQALQFLNDELGSSGELDYRVIDGRLVIATREFIDRQETVLIAYDLAKQVADRADADHLGPVPAAAAVTQEVLTVLEHMVHPEGWQDNGGSLASTAVFGSKLFIKAPKRYHTEIQWVISELPKSKEAADPTGAATDPSRAHALVDAEVSAPILSDIPILERQFKNVTNVAPAIGDGPITVKAENGGKVDVTGPRGSIKADKIHINTTDAKPAADPGPRPTDPFSASPAPAPQPR